MDEVIFEEFKGTGNMELKLDRQLANRRIFPAVDVNNSGTRKEEILLAPEELKIMWKLRRVLAALDSQQGIELLLDRLRKTQEQLRVPDPGPADELDQARRRGRRLSRSEHIHDVRRVPGWGPPHGIPARPSPTPSRTIDGSRRCSGAKRNGAGSGRKGAGADGSAGRERRIAGNGEVVKPRVR